jgi:hypothetical protein
MARGDPFDSGFLGKEPTKELHEVMVFDNRAYKIHNVLVHTFNMGDVEDPDLYAAEPLLNWQHSESGQWVMSKAVETPMWHRMHDYASYGYRYGVTAKLKDVDYTYWCLKWANTVDNTHR